MSKVELTSKEIEDSRFFIKGAKKPELLVLVEDEQDVPFWSKVFGCVNDKYHRIHVHSLQTAPLQTNKDGRTLKGNGKENLMNIKQETLGKSKMIAVDADYDLLIDDYHIYTERLRKGQFIVHTNFYSIENHLINRTTLQALDIWERLGTDKVQRSWDDILNSFGDAVCHSVKLCIASSTHGISELKTGRSLSPMLSIDTLHSEVKKLLYNPATYENDNSNWKTSVEAAYSGLKEFCSKEFAAIDAKITDKDILNHIQGHTLFDYIEKVVKYYFLIDYGMGEDKCKKDASNGGGLAVGKAVRDFRAMILNGTANSTDCVRNSIYNASALDISSQDIKDIQAQITRICNM